TFPSWSPLATFLIIGEARWSVGLLARPFYRRFVLARCWALLRLWPSCWFVFRCSLWAMWTILLVGFFNSIMFPSIFTLGIAELGPLTGDGSGLLVMAIVGGAIIPVVMGALADRMGIQHAFILPAFCYLYILYYALRGSKPVVPVWAFEPSPKGAPKRLTY